jgi:hypothetical protein
MVLTAEMSMLIEPPLDEFGDISFVPHFPRQKKYPLPEAFKMR